MFQYALGRYLAEEMGYELKADPLIFPNTREKIEGRSHGAAPTRVLTGNHCDVEELLAEDTDRLIVVDGFFQQSRIYLPYMDRIRKWFEMDVILPSDLKGVSHEDLLIYVRLGDYWTLNVGLGADFYEAVIEMAAPRRVYIATEQPEHSFFENFQKYSPFFTNLDPLSDLLAARIFRKIAISCSTFAWWAAVLSDARLIYFPVDEEGVWFCCNREPIDRDDIDLRIDESKFVYFYNCPNIRSARKSSEHVALSEVSPILMRHHVNSQAFWFR